MILFLSWPVLLFLAGIWAVFSVICAVLYGIQNSWDDERAKWLRTFSVKEKWGLFALLLAIIGGAVAFGCGIAYHKPLPGVLGFLGMLIAGVIAAYLCSPMKWDWESAGGMGCNPLGVIASMASLLLVVAFSWLFILLAIFRKSTWRLYVGIVLAVGVLLMGIAGGLVLYEKQETKNLHLAAETYIAQGDYESAMTLYQKMGENDLYLQTWYDFGMWQLAQGEEYKAIQTLKELDNAYRYKDSGLQAKKITYDRGLRSEESGAYAGAINNFKEILDYEDAREHYKYNNYMYGLDRMASCLFEEATEYFREAGDYGDAAHYVLYSQVRTLANDNLLKAEELLRQLPRDFLEVDMLLTAVEDYGYLNGGYTITKATGDDPFGYSTAWVSLVYEQHIGEKTPNLEFEVTLVLSRKGIDYGSEGEMPKKGVLKFEDGEKKFTVTEKTVKVEETREPVGSSIKSEIKNYYTFERVNDNR